MEMHPVGQFVFDILQQTTTNTTTGNTHNYQHEIDVGKIVSVPVVFFIVLISCLIPQVLIRVQKRANLIIQFLTCLAGGALLSIGLLHIIPHARENFELYEEDGGHDDHAGHNHFEMMAEYNNTNHLPSTGRIITTMQSQINKRGDIILQQGTDAIVMTTTQIGNIEKFVQNNGLIDIATQASEFAILQDVVEEEEEEAHAHNHGFPWTELICGLVIMLLMLVESALHLYLAKRGSTVSLHSHGGEACGSGHSHGHGHSHHGHGHSHHGHHHHDHHAATPHTSEECVAIELQPSSAGPSTPTNVNSSGEHHHQHGHGASSGNTTPENSQTPTDANNNNNNSTQVIDPDDEYAGLTPVERELLDKKKAIDAYVSCIAISLHCIFNGLSLGAMSGSTKTAAAQFWTFFGATVGHKVCDALAVAIPLARSKLSRVHAIFIILGVSFATPLGVIIGYFATTQNGHAYLAQAILLALSSGSFFYISMCEMIPNGIKGRYFPLKWCFVAIGFLIPAIIAEYA